MRLLWLPEHYHWYRVWLFAKAPSTVLFDIIWSRILVRHCYLLATSPSAWHSHSRWKPANNDNIKKKFKKKIMSIVFCHHCGLILSTAHNQCVRFQRQTTFARPLAHLGEGKNWPIADRRVPNNDPRNKSRTHFGSSILLLTFRERMYWFVFEYLWSWEFFHAWRGKDANDKCQQKLHSVSFHQHSKGVTPMSF